jgi:hypothetical protein
MGVRALFFFLSGTMGVKAGYKCGCSCWSLLKLDRRENVEREVRDFAGTTMELSSSSEELEELSTLSSTNTLLLLLDEGFFGA